MTVRRAADGTLHLEGVCGSEAAHAAVVQVLLTLRPQLRGVPASTFLARHVAPVLNRPPAGGVARLEA